MSLSNGLIADVENRRAYERKLVNMSIFIPYRRFMVLLKVDNDSNIYSSRFCRKALAVKKAIERSRFKGIVASVFDTKEQEYVVCPATETTEINDSLFEG